MQSEALALVVLCLALPEKKVVVREDTDRAAARAIRKLNSKSGKGNKNVIRHSDICTQSNFKPAKYREPKVSRSEQTIHTSQRVQMVDRSGQQSRQDGRKTRQTALSGKRNKDVTRISKHAVKLPSAIQPKCDFCIGYTSSRARRPQKEKQIRPARAITGTRCSPGSQQSSSLHGSIVHTSFGSAVSVTVAQA